ncbi:hypothetical protein A0H81_08280 [Grifola frondosa]|uniref:BOD1/SHG1 domain-containing protein n=1 Tax=Grifola frondosa TaxID=5627 RepID=A0A1C7M593_GRIFR|nr:hypothetical protein A0H81_08280 [Grifola frondosa]
MAILNPTQLVDEFKKSGEFDRLRRELLAQFRHSEGMPAFMSRIEDIARQKLDADPKLQYMSEPAVARELMQELDRYPVVERAVADVRILSDPAFASGIRASVQNILREDRKNASSGGASGEQEDEAGANVTPKADADKMERTAGDEKPRTVHFQNSTSEEPEPESISEDESDEDDDMDIGSP